MATAVASSALSQGVQISEDENRWLIVGVALNKYVVPCLARKVKCVMEDVYTSLKASNNIHQQTYPNQLKAHGIKDLNYSNINGNSNPDPGTQQKKPKPSWDYKVSTAFDLARLFMQSHMAKSTSFEQSDASALLGLVSNVEDSSCQGIFTSMKAEVEAVRDSRNSWAHCHMPDWNQSNFDKSFVAMENLLRKLSAAPPNSTELEKLWKKGKPQYNMLHYKSQIKCGSMVAPKCVRGNQVFRTRPMFQGHNIDVLFDLFTRYKVNDTSSSGLNTGSDQENARILLKYMGIAIRALESWMKDETDKSRHTHQEQHRAVVHRIEQLEKHLPSLADAGKYYQQRLTDFYKHKLTRENPCNDVPYMSTTINVQQNKPAVHYREFEKLPMEQSAIVIDHARLFHRVPELDNKVDPRTVLLLGVPGVGKTSLCYKLLKDITDNKALFTAADTIPVLIRFRETNLIKHDISFLDLLLDHCGPTVQQHERSAVETYLMENEDKICFIIDGADEAEGIGVNYKEEYTQRFSAVDRVTKPQILFFNLLSGVIMGKSKVLITSRMFCLDKLKPWVNRVVNLNGLDNEQIKELVRRILGPELLSLHTSFMKYLEDHHHIAGLCYVPRQAICLITYMKEAADGQENPTMANIDMPESMAGLLLMVILHAVRESQKFKNRDEFGILKEAGPTLARFSELSYSGLFSDKGVQQVFTDENIENHSITAEDLQCGIVSGREVSRRRLLSPQTLCFIYSFLHLTMQEMLAGLKLTSLPDEELKRLILQCHGEHQMTWLLFFGACGDMTVNELIPCIYHSVLDKVPTAQVFEDKAREVLQTLYESARDVDDVTQLYLIHALSESQQCSLADLLTPALLDWTGIWDMPDTSAADHTAVARYLSNVNHKSIDIICVRSQTGASGLRTMLTGPCMAGYTGLWMRYDVPRDVLDIVRQITREHSALQYLRLGSGLATIDQLSCFVDTANTSIKHLTLAASNIKPGWLCDNLQQLQSLEALTLRLCKLKGRTQWGHVLHQLTNHLKYLTLYWCRGLDDEAVEEVCQLITTKHLTYLHLKGGAIHDVSLERLARCLQSDTCSLTALTVQECMHTTSDGQQALCLHKYPHMRILGLDVYNLDHVSYMLQKNTQIEELYLRFRGNTEGELSLPDNSALQCLQCDDINDDGVKSLTATLQHNCKPPCLKLSTSYSTKLSVSLVSELITTTHLHTLDLCRAVLHEDDDWQQVADAVSHSPTLHTVGVNERKPFLQGLVEHYPQGGPLRAVYCYGSAKDEERSLEQKLKEKLGPETVQVYYAVRNMGVQAGFKWRSLPQHTRYRLYCDII